MGITRRDLLVGGLSVGAAGVGLGWYTGDLNAGAVGNVTGGMVETPDPNAMEQALSGGFDQLVWQSDGTAEIYFDEYHQMKSIHLLHESQDNPADEIAACGLPGSSEVIKAPIVQFIRSVGVKFPSRVFKLVGTDVINQGCNQPAYGTPYETYGTAYFTVPERFEL